MGDALDVVLGLTTLEIFQLSEQRVETMLRCMKIGTDESIVKNILIDAFFVN
jgi:hypothetical protein